MTIKERALDYAKKHFSVIPIKKGEKAPAVSWKEFQTRIASVEEIDKWFTQWPDANYGIVCGEISGITVVDVEAGGDISYLPETYTVKTGGGGYHFYYLYEPGVINGTRVKELTDIRSEGGQVVGPGSLHRSGDHYEVVKDIPMVKFPKHLFKAEPKQKNFTDSFNTIDQGSRNEAAAKFIGLLLKLSNRHDWSSTTWQLFQTWNRTFCNPPLDNQELQNIFKSIAKREENKTTADEDDIPIVHISESQDNNGQLSVPISMGYEQLDKAMLGGIREGDLAVVTGISGQGKTILLQNISLNISKISTGVLWFSYEVMMNNFYVKMKDMALSCGMDIGLLPVFVPKRAASGNIGWIKSKIELAKKEQNVRYVFIDHIDFIAPMNIKTGDQKRMILKQITTELKQLAIELKISIFLVAHVKKVQGREIEMQDIAESSGIYQLADYVISVQRISEKVKIGGVIVDAETDRSLIKMLKNRLTGDKPIIEFKLINNLIETL